jgi:hypothetical protein
MASPGLTWAKGPRWEAGSRFGRSWAPDRRIRRSKQGPSSLRGRSDSSLVPLLTSAGGVDSVPVRIRIHCLPGAAGTPYSPAWTRIVAAQELPDSPLALCRTRPVVAGILATTARHGHTAPTRPVELLVHALLGIVIAVPLHRARWVSKIPRARGHELY